MESLSQGDSSANSSDPDDELGPAYINELGIARILGRMTGNSEITQLGSSSRAPLLAPSPLTARGGTRFFRMTESVTKIAAIPRLVDS